MATGRDGAAARLVVVGQANAGGRKKTSTGSSAAKAGTRDPELRALEKLAELRNQGGGLEQRAGELAEKLERSEDVERELLEALEAVKTGLVDGGPADEIPILVAKLGGQREATAALRGAVQKIQAEAGQVADEIDRIELGIERRRQALAVLPLHAEHEKLVKSWIDSVVSLHDSLRAARELRERCAREFPLVPGPAAPELSGLIRELSAAMKHPDRGQDMAIRLWLLSMLKGPLGSWNDRSATINPAHLAGVGVEDK